MSDVASQLTGTVNGAAWANTLSQRFGYPCHRRRAVLHQRLHQHRSMRIPQCRDSSVRIQYTRQVLMKYIPLPNVGSASPLRPTRKRWGTTKPARRIDGNTRLGMVSGYYFIDDDILVNPYGGASLPGFASRNNGRAQMFNVGITKTLAPRPSTSSGSATCAMCSSPKPRWGAWALASARASLASSRMNPTYEGVEPIGFNNYSIGVANNFLRVYDNTYNFADNFSKVIGTHTLKFGGAFSYDQVDYRFTLNLNGSFGFNGNETGFDFADFLIGAPNSYSQGLQLPVYSRARYLQPLRPG